MDNRINELRSQIRKLRTRMLEAEVVMAEQIQHDKECSKIATEILKMRAAMTELVRERGRLGDDEPIQVNYFFVPSRPVAFRPFPTRVVKRRLMPGHGYADETHKCI